MSGRRLREVVENHPIFKNLEPIKQSDCAFQRLDQLMQVQDGNLYVWSNKRSCLYVSNLRMSLDEEVPKVQTLTCSSAPIFDIHQMSFNNNGTLVALVGSRGLSVVTLPERWKRVSMEDSELFCKCIPVAERFFATCIMVQLVQATWHPGSSVGTHVCLLLSDNTLRIYDLSKDNQTPFQVHKIGHFNIGSSRFSIVSSAYSVRSAIGETVVSFSFAPPVEVQEKRKNILEARKSTKNNSPTALLYPIYLLQGDGDILLLLTSVTDNRYKKGLLRGPLKMQPPAEDNYGVDACSILVLHNTPAVIAVATTSGKVHHCVALTTTNYDSEEELAEDQSTVSWPNSVLSVSSSAPGGVFTEPTLYVYETVEIDLELMRGSSEEDEDENYIITLLPDPLMSCRYHCCTKVGVHTAVLPWMEKMFLFFENEYENKDSLLNLAEDQPCIVEHIICTKPTPSTSLCVIEGFTFTTDLLFGPSALCLTSDSRCLAVPLLTAVKPVAPELPLSSNFYGRISTPGTHPNPLSPLQRISGMDFQDHIKSILKRDSSQPLLRCQPSSRNLTFESECSQMISRVTQVLRKEYILKRKLAKDTIEKRACLLEEQKRKQKEELKALKMRQQELTKSAEQLAEKYEDCVEQQAELSNRLEVVLKYVKSKVPVLSKAEIDMSKELAVISDQMKHLQNGIKQVKTKHDYQNEQNFGEGDAKEKPSVPSVGNPIQIQQFKEILQGEGQKIQELTKKLNILKKNAGL